MNIRLVSFEDQYIKLQFNADNIGDDVELAEIELLQEDAALDDIKRSLKKFKIIQSELNDLFEDDGEDDE
mgnify:CR=1 FL=1